MVSWNEWARRGNGKALKRERDCARRNFGLGPGRKWENEMNEKGNYRNHYHFGTGNNLGKGEMRDGMVYRFHQMMGERKYINSKFGRGFVTRRWQTEEKKKTTNDLVVEEEE